MPDAIEGVRPGWRLIGYRVPLGRRDAYFGYIAPEIEHVHLGFEYGVFMDDPDGVLQGVGSQVRYVTLWRPDEIAEPVLEGLVHEAVRVSAMVVSATDCPGRELPKERSMSDYNKQLIEELRSNGGEIAAGPMAGRPLLILTTTGARSLQSREAVLTFTKDGDRYVIAGSAGGSPTDPAWLHNLVANPTVRVEAKGRSFQARATVVDATERERLWNAHVAERPEFAGYPEQAGRVIPVVALEPISEAA